MPMVFKSHSYNAGTLSKPRTITCYLVILTTSNTYNSPKYYHVNTFNIFKPGLPSKQARHITKPIRKLTPIIYHTMNYILFSE